MDEFFDDCGLYIDEEDLDDFEIEPLFPEDLGWGEDYLETDDYEEDEQ